LFLRVERRESRGSFSSDARVLGIARTHDRPSPLRPARPDACALLLLVGLPLRIGKSVLDLCTYKGDFDRTKVDPSSRGPEKTLEYRINFSHKDKKISPWHDIPYRASSETFHMMCEIPKWTRAKFEIATKEPGNPMKQDEKKGVLREYKHGDMLFNYGFMPQTWEDPEHVSEDTGFKGDDDPLDMVEIGCRQMKCGQVVEVKVLGVLAMIDDGETDWKVFCVRTDDPLAGVMNDVDDLERELPGVVSTMREWFRQYKVAEGKPLNRFALDERCMDREYAEKIIEETHGSWKRAEETLRKNHH
jgi:inorganic pyrophosphatase